MTSHRLARPFTRPFTAQPFAAPITVPITAACLAFLLSACGGGGDSGSAAGGTATGAGSSSGATAYAAGPVTGLGSVIVNGIRYDDSSARVLNDDNVELSGSNRRLKVGMQVEVGSGAVDDSAARAKAETIRIGSELVGTVERVTLDASGQVQSFVLLGQTVLVQRPGTAVDDSLAGGFAAIKVGALLEVHASFNGSAYVASFIEGRAPGAVSRYKVRGVITAVDPTARTFVIGGATFSSAGLTASTLTAPLAVGTLVRVDVATGAVAGAGPLQALAVRSGSRSSNSVVGAGAVGDARLRGTITQALAASSFELDGVTVRVDGSTRFDAGSLANLLKGAVVDVRGVLQGGVLVASRISLRKADNDVRAGGGIDDVGGIELHGTASAIDLTANRFTLTHSSGTAYTVTYTLDFDAIVSSAPKLEVKGTLGADGRSIQAVRIQRED